VLGSDANIAYRRRIPVSDNGTTLTTPRSMTFFDIPSFVLGTKAHRCLDFESLQRRRICVAPDEVLNADIEFIPSNEGPSATSIGLRIVSG
jgi:hypothetical protein